MVRVFVLAAIGAFSASLATAAERDQQAACEALEPVIAAYSAHAASGETLNFSAGQALPLLDWSNGATLTQASGWNRAAPSAETLRRLSEVTPTNAMTCPNFARQASVLGRVLTDDQRRAIYRSRGGAPRARVQVVTMPVIDKSGQEGLVKIRVQRNGLGQVENLYYLRKTKAGWRISGERETPPQDLRPLG
jgi:hypothetical protein